MKIRLGLREEQSEVFIKKWRKRVFKMRYEESQILTAYDSKLVKITLH